MEGGWGGDSADVCAWVTGKSPGTDVYMGKLTRKCKMWVSKTADKAYDTNDWTMDNGLDNHLTMIRNL